MKCKYSDIKAIYDWCDKYADDEYINERIAGWNNVKNTIKEIKESYLGE